MRWRIRLGERNFQVQYKEGPKNLHAYAISRLRTNAEIASDDWDKIPSFLIHTHSGSTDSLLPKHSFKRIQNQQARQDYIVTNDKRIHDNSISEALSATVPKPTPADPCSNQFQSKN